MKFYIVKYSTGSYDDYREVDIFVTSNIDTAKAYVKRFNAIAKKWKDYYSKYIDKATGWVKEDVDVQFDRCCMVVDFNKCFYTEIESR